MQKIRCVLVCVGTELLRGKVNTHGSHLARRLASIGLELHEEVTVRDELPAITRAIRQALGDAQVVVVTGGLGPTFDDLTREAAAKATGKPLEFSQSLLKGIKAKFRHARFRMPAANARQADVLQGARVIPNDVGTAPGQILFMDPQVLILLPGPPRELYPMLEHSVLPALRKAFPAYPRAESHLHFAGVPESVVDHKIRPVIARFGGDAVQFTILARLGLVDLDVYVSDKSASGARGTLRRLEHSIRTRLGGAWYGSNADYPLEKVVRDRFCKKRATLAVAESCTGGLLAGRITDVPGSSDYFVEGRVTYANAAKMRVLGVPAELIRRFGAVSRPVAQAMAKGIRQQAGTTWGAGVTGIAGPGGGTPGKPVGLVFIALASQKRAFCRRYQFTGDREAIRERTVVAALDLLRRVN
jgi:nicotinamide-nucleotide amidase